MTLSIADIATLPLFNQDMETQLPAEVTTLKESIKNADGIIFVTPEHNRSIPAVLKNALDWASRPYGTNAWTGKPTITMGVTPGGLGASQAQAHLRQIIAYLDMRLMGQPEVYISSIGDKLSDDGSIKDEALRTHLTGALATFATFVAKMK
jgi:chromate reductase